MTLSMAILPCYLGMPLYSQLLSTATHVMRMRIPIYIKSMLSNKVTDLHALKDIILSDIVIHVVKMLIL